MTITAIDLFAGAGGFTTGAQRAGVNVVWAANHWPQAVDFHLANHPHVQHATQDLQQFPWALAPDHDLLLASPACQGHSQAGQPGRWNPEVLLRQQADRNTAWAVIACAEAKRPTTILVENVGDFLRWPLLPAWRQALEILGYTVRCHVMDAADFGVPQNRKRAVITARIGAPLELESPRLPHVPFGSCVDWSVGSWGLLKDKPAGVLNRVRAARKRGLGDRFLSHYVSDHKGRCLSRPIGCVTTKDQWALVDGDRIRMLTLVELRRAMTFDDNYTLPATRSLAVRMLGNAIPPAFAEALVRQAIA